MASLTPAVPPSFLELFLASVARSPDAVAWEELPGERADDAGRAPLKLTYAELLAYMERCRGALAELGLQRGEAVLVALPRAIELSATIYALASSGAVAVPLDPRLRPFELAPILRDARPVGIVCQAGLPPALAQSLDACESLRFVLSLQPSDPGASPLSPRARIATLDALGARPRPLEVPSGDPLITCHFTYKGLGYPLGARHRLSDYAHAVAPTLGLFPLEAGRPLLVGLPAHPVYALIAMVMNPLAQGAKLLLVHRPHRQDMVTVFERERVQLACFVPELFRALLFQLGERRFPAGVRLVSGASHLDAALTRVIVEATGVEPIQGYGLTETLPIAANVPAGPWGSLGRPYVAGGQVRVQDGAGRGVEPGRAGEIYIRGPTVMHDYVQRPDETAAFIKDGWFRTGDLGSIDSNGYLHFVGRALPFAKIMSQMVDLVEVENVLRAHPGVADARVTVDRDGQAGDRLIGAVALHRRGAADAAQLQAHLESHLSRHKVPAELRVLVRGDVAAAAEASSSPGPSQEAARGS